LPISVSRIVKVSVLHYLRLSDISFEIEFAMSSSIGRSVEAINSSNKDPREGI
jgi:hypothetical protein